MGIKVRIPDLLWYRDNVPCMSGCPVHTDSGRYVQLIAEGDLEGAYWIARSSNPFASVCGRICAAPCEDACRRGKVDDPVTIRSLKRFLTEQFGPESRDPKGYEELIRKHGEKGSWWGWHVPVLVKRKTPFRDKVAVIGAGPAGLACAHDLALMGYEVTIFEAFDQPGGMLVKGIPMYRLPRYVLQLEVAAIEKLGVKIEYNRPLTADFGLRELREQGYKAIFLSVGAGVGKSLDIEGANLDGVFTAVEYLLNVNRGYRVDLGRRVVVIGGGLVALDAARTALRVGLEVPEEIGETMKTAAEAGALISAIDVARMALRGGAFEVHVVSLESYEEMPATRNILGREEIEEAKREGIRFHHRLGPKRILATNGQIRGVEFLRVSRVFDEKGLFNPELIPGTEELIEADSVLLAIGQEPDLSFLRPEDGVELTPHGTIKVDPATLATSVPGVFAGGDAAFGPRIAIEAIANGKLAAQSIDSYLRGEKKSRKSLSVQIEVIPTRIYRMSEDYEKKRRSGAPRIPIERRTGVAEVELPFAPKDAWEQASRCLYCHINTIYDSEKCVLCGMCVEVCPEKCLRLVPLEQLEMEAEEKIRVFEQLGYSEGDRNLMAMIKDEETCIRCGLCALRCPTEAMTMERFDFKEVYT